MENQKPIIAAFDFDGTITTKDTLLEFIKFSKGKLQFYAVFLLFLPLLVAMKLKVVPNWKVKQQIFSFFFKGMKLTEFDKLCENFAEKCRELQLRVSTINSIKAHQQNGDKIVIISASIENWVKPIAEKMGIVDILCTKIEIDKNNCLTGKFVTKNCYGQEKVERLLAVFPNRAEYCLVAYGDSRGDRELLAFADEKTLL